MKITKQNESWMLFFISVVFQLYRITATQVIKFLDFCLHKYLRAKTEPGKVINMLKINIDNVAIFKNYVFKIFLYFQGSCLTITRKSLKTFFF